MDSINITSHTHIHPLTTPFLDVTSQQQTINWIHCQQKAIIFISAEKDECFSLSLRVDEEQLNSYFVVLHEGQSKSFATLYLN